MRCYHMQNMYLSGTQAGIQTAHAQHEMAIKYLFEKNDGQCHDMYLDWAKNHKTIILLNGGMMAQLSAIKQMLESSDNPYPWACFHESEAALNGALTNIGVVLPYKIYALKGIIQEYLRWEFKETEDDEDKQPREYRVKTTLPNGDGCSIKVSCHVSRNKLEQISVSLFYLDESGNIITGTDVVEYKYTSFDLMIMRTVDSLRLM